jgi:hypothetical protein
MNVTGSFMLMTEYGPGLLKPIVEGGSNPRPQGTVLSGDRNSRFMWISMGISVVVMLLVHG